MLEEKFGLKDLPSAEKYLEDKKKDLSRIEGQMESLLNEIKKEYQW